MKGEAEKAGIKSEEDLNKLVKEIRKRDGRTRDVF